ncbi:TetR/AcrR family transcriptional regulator [Paenibacillus sp. SI8]|uniref:TetR/AcrR family transcriptional regulator n=1 Tax=unclassified Paenibacillus TaxID=185978 RepID=UPI0034662C53
MENQPSEKSPLGRPRSEQARQAIMNATLSLLKTEGYKKLTMEGIAKAAGVGKPTLYRWWPNIPTIVMEAVQLQAISGIVLAETDSLRSDLLQYLGQTCQLFNGYLGEILRCLMAEAQLNPDFAIVFREELIQTRRTKLIEIIERGVSRNPLRSELNLEFLADLGYGPIWYRLLNGHAALDEPFVHSIVDQIIYNIDRAGSN